MKKAGVPGIGFRRARRGIEWVGIYSLGFITVPASRIVPVVFSQIK